MTNHRQLYVLCDTNAAVHDAHLFRKRNGSDLVAILRAKKAKLVIPDVLRNEYITQFVKAGDAALAKATEGLDRLKTFCGYNINELLPRQQFGETQALEILEQLEDIIHPIPTTSELKVAAADRSIKGIRPTSKSDHGYKDCLIWESLLTLPKGSDVILLSRDEAAFFEKVGIFALSLKKEAEEKGLSVTAYSATKNPTLTPLIEALKERFSDVTVLMAAEHRIDDHPIIKAHMQTELSAPVLPKNSAVETTPLVAEAADELEALLLEQMRRFTQTDIKALGIISYLGSICKLVVIELLGQSGVTPGTAKNALDRLALAGLIVDTGHNYLPASGRQAEMAAQLVEAEMIKLAGLGD